MKFWCCLNAKNIFAKQSDLLSYVNCIIGSFAIYFPDALYSGPHSCLIVFVEGLETKSKCVGQRERLLVDFKQSLLIPN
ncbi:hypothetical protein OPV22_005252 [Ensete ventricosum]|uniref:Uncharacterized protein n=1 Tax=Ensete ventricosum TaxID=4639 RepID=A0AAV8RI35_ENSVE|nr:hypothetical protein OPV22_005252 [Ensete ventricosum]